MDLHRYAGLVDQLAAEYTLGVLRGGSRRRFEQISQHDPVIRLAVETWRLRLTAMSELGPAVAPPPEIWAVFTCSGWATPVMLAVPGPHTPID